MNKRSRILLIIFAFFSSGALLFGGGEKDNSKAEDGPVILRVLNYFDMTLANSAEEIAVIWDAFEKANPDIKILREDLFNEPFHNKAEVYAAAGQLPDVMHVWPSGRSTTFHRNHLLKDLGPLIDRDNLRSVFFASALDPLNQHAGYAAMIPQALTSSHAFYINHEVLRDCGLEPARTYAELKAQVPVLRRRGYDTVLMANQDAWVMQSCLFSMIAGRFCGRDWDKRILDGSAKFTDSDFTAALAFIKTMYDDGVLNKTSLAMSYGDVVGQFAANKGAYLIDGDWRAGAFITDKSTGEALISPERQKNIAVSVFPDIEGAKLNKSTSGILGTGWGMSAAIPEGSEKEEAAWRLIKWLTGREVLMFRIEAGYFSTPSRMDIDTGEMKLEPIQQAVGKLGQQYTAATAVIDGVFHSDVYNPLNDGLQEIGMGLKTPQQAAAALQRAFATWSRYR